LGLGLGLGCANPNPKPDLGGEVELDAVTRGVHVAHDVAQRRDGVGQEGVVDVRVEPVALVQRQHVGTQLREPCRVGCVPVSVLGVEVPLPRVRREPVPAVVHLVRVRVRVRVGVGVGARVGLV